MDLVERLEREAKFPIPSVGTVAEAAAEIRRLRNRIAVLEHVIAEEVDVMDCKDNANEMIVEMILKQKVARESQ